MAIDPEKLKALSKQKKGKPMPFGKPEFDDEEDNGEDPGKGPPVRADALSVLKNMRAQLDKAIADLEE